MRTWSSLFAVLTLSLLVALLAGPALAAQEPARIVYFSSPHCPFCTIVGERDLAPLQARHGDALQVRVIDTSTAPGAQALRAMWEARGVAEGRRGVPTVVIGDRVLVGAREIPESLPGLIDDALGAGGAPWPALPGLDALPSDAPIVSPRRDGWIDRVGADVPGNYVAIGLLLAMLALAAAMIPPGRWQARLSDETPLAAKVGVALVGLSAAAYLTWSETTERELVCGPIGQCNVVQHSDMATLWGLFPIAPLGALAYVALLVVYAIGALGPPQLARWAPLATLALTGFGFAFSAVLTFWQPFMIGATCAWCLISALSMTVSCALAIGAGRRQLGALLGGAHSQAA